MMNRLTDLHLRAVYDSAECHLVNDLIVPLLSHSVEYCRGVGYFSSGWLKVAAAGLVALIERGGRAQLIMSPIMSETDWDAIVLGQKARDDHALRQLLEAAIGDLQGSLETHTLNAFAWMLADELLDIRFAVPREAFSTGDYHDKVAYFRDENGNCVAIHGSYNDSIKGTLNGEAFSVFQSWIPGQQPFVEKHVSRLTQLWETGNAQFYSIRLPEAVRERIVKLRQTSARPYLRTTCIVPVPSAPCIPEGVCLREYQRDSIESWKQQSCQGIFEMATGSGKTYTALAAAVEQLQLRQKLATVVLVPYMHLLEQWRKDCESFGMRPVLCGSSHSRWKTELRAAVSDYRLGRSNLCVLAVHQTASGEAFRRALLPLPDGEKLVIADEVHGLGAPQLRKALQDGFGLRLGLSATPRRWYDDEGTQTLFDYFGGVCFTFTLDDAIREGFLVPYRYEPHLVNLTEDEESGVSDLTETIGRLLAKKRTGGLEEAEQAYLDKAMRDRARIVKQAELKFDGLRRIIRDMRQCNQRLEHALFYAPEGAHDCVLTLLKEEGVMARQFIGEDSAVARRQILTEFDAGRIPALVAMKCLDEGVDVPSTRTAFLVASTTNPREFIQRRGRILRRCHGKARAVVHDFIVTPTVSSPPEVATYLLNREMPRFAECAASAENAFAARHIVRPVLDAHEMLHLMDMKPWEVYHSQPMDNRDT